MARREDWVIERRAWLSVLRAAVEVARRETLPVLEHALIVPDEGRTAIIAGDTAVELTGWVEGPAAEAMCVPARKLWDVLRALPEGEAVHLKPAQGQLRILAGRSRFTLTTMPAEAFPRLDGGVGDKEAHAGCVAEVSLPGGVLRRLLTRVAPAMAANDVRTSLNGVLLRVRPGRLTAVASDGHRLALDEAVVQWAGESEAQAIVPRATVLLLSKLLEGGRDAEEADEVRLTLGRWVDVRHARFALRSKVVDGRFPDYEQALPEPDGDAVTVGRAALAQALAQAATVADAKTMGMRLTWGDDEVRLSCGNLAQDQAEVWLPGVCAGNAVEIGVNVRYLQDMLAQAGGSEVRMESALRGRALRVCALGDEAFLGVVMAMRV